MGQRKYDAIVQSMPTLEKRVYKFVRKTMNKDYCRDVDLSPRYYNSGKAREISNITVGY